ncbi:protein unc-93 homolog A [Lingula anatina]|uniref:Protein unc-93 homolog A n=1 Tax=Lingula anatina TaxID=7574 RepID=A0A1S3JPM0_LINAN|nr:protein unc-93 homolog A [Lingula anatina]|eukprot:XP_013411924.1 protein unc-93 homolog A [Lingula anatina]
MTDGKTKNERKGLGRLIEPLKQGSAFLIKQWKKIQGIVLRKGNGTSTAESDPPTTEPSKCPTSSAVGGETTRHGDSFQEKVIAKRKRPVLNVIVLSIAFVFVYTAFLSLQSLQNTINAEGGVGVVSLSCIHGSTVVSCVLAPWIIQRLSTKWTIITSFSFFLMYITANFYPEHIVMIPASILLGMTFGPLWSSQSTYLTTAALDRALTTGNEEDTVIAQFNGLFWGILQLSQIAGNVISASVLADDHVAHLNKNASHRNAPLCGAQDCSVHNKFKVDFREKDPLFAHVPRKFEYVLLGIFLGCVLMGIVIAAVLLDRQENDDDEEKDKQQEPANQRLLASLRLLKSKELLLLVPLVVYTGMAQGFVYGDFTKSFVNCSLGVHNLGLVMISFGATNAVSCFSLGFLNKYTPRSHIIIAGTFFNVGILIVLLIWIPDHTDIPMFFVVAACLGVCDSIWQTQTNSLFGVIFRSRQTEAFANFRMFQATGLAISFGYSYFLCVETKVFILGTTLVAALAGYVVLEWRQRKFDQGVNFNVVVL